MSRSTRVVIKRFLVINAIIAAAWVARLEAQDSQDARAVAAESLMVEAMGGRKGWESARFFDFIWAVERPNGVRVERHHVWDRWTGRYKLEAPAGDHKMVAVFDAYKKEGDVWLDGHKLAGDSLARMLDRAHAIYINDTYWFIMPFKWRDPGVHLTYVATEQDSAGVPLDVVELTFESVGRTPRNKYHVYIDSRTHLIRWWDHWRDRDDPHPAFRARWEDWEQRGPIRVSLSRPIEESGSRIFFPRAVISTDIDEQAFAPPEH